MAGSVIRIILPECSDDQVSEWLRHLTGAVLDATGKGHDPGGIGGRNGYGANFENDVFFMRRYCWCERDDCGLCCGYTPNFKHNRSGASISWYKYIGRSMCVDKANWPEIFKECLASL